MIGILIFIVLIISATIILIPFSEKQKNNKNSQNIDLQEISEDVYEKLREADKKQKIKNYVSQMKLYEILQLLPDDIFRTLPKKREAINEYLVNKILNGEIDFKVNGNLYYVDSDKVAENTKDYYTENFIERKENIKKFTSIRKENGFSVNMDIFSNTSSNNINLRNKEDIIKNISPELINQRQVLTETLKKIQEKKVIDTLNMSNFKHSNMPSNVLELEEKIKHTIKLEPTKENLKTFEAILNEYNNLDFDSKIKISRKYTSQLELLRNKAMRL